MEMVEKVARAIAAEMGTDWGGPLGESDLSFLPYKARYMSMARAAIEAMREPTEAMKEAGFQAGHLGDGEWEYADPESAYTAMIDAALSPSGEK